jgi:flagellar M-ring protein FliF
MADGVEQTVGAKALAVVAQARGRFDALPAQRRNWVMAGGALLLAVVAGMAWYAQRPDWRVLFSGLEGRDASQVAQELGAAGIPFEMTADGGGVEVPAESLDKARMEVAAKGMPASGRLGFELFDKPNWVGSEFDERVNYQRALEGELEHTIGTLGVVRSARVHLVLPQASLFTSEQKVAKASVVLKLKRSSLDPEQTESIRNLVAGAVENLSPEQVTLVDADGRANLRTPGRGAIAGDEERQLESRLVAMLEPMAGAGNVRATVNVSYDEGSEERTDEVYDPAQTATLSMQKSEQVSGAARAAQGVPGTASNTPAAAPAGAVQGSAKAAAPGTPPLLQPAAGKDGLPVYPQNGNGQGQTTKEENGTYAVSRHVVHSEEGPGRLRRITAAVVVNDRMTVEGAGKGSHEAWKPRTTDEMRRLEQLAQAAVGFDEKRGDQVVMENVSFTSNAPEAAPAGMEKVLDQAKGLLTTQPALLKTGMMGLLGVMVVMLVLKPVAGQMVVAMRGPEELQGGRGEARLLVSGYERRAEEVRESAALSAGNAPVAPKVVEPEQTTAVMEEVTGHIRREPVHSTRLLESWLSAGGDE